MKPTAAEQYPTAQAQLPGQAYMLMFELRYLGESSG